MFRRSLPRKTRKIAGLRLMPHVPVLFIKSSRRLLGHNMASVAGRVSTTFKCRYFIPFVENRHSKAEGKKKKKHTRPFPIPTHRAHDASSVRCPFNSASAVPTGKSRGRSGDTRALAIWRGSKALCAIVGRGQGACETPGTWALGGRTNISQSMDSLNAMCANRGPERSTRDVMRAGVKILQHGAVGGRWD